MMYDNLDDSIDPELQVRLLNLVLGEASDFERDQLQMLMEQQPELLSHFRQLLHLHGLLRDVGLGDPIVPPLNEPLQSERAVPTKDDEDASWRLSEDRRAVLLAKLQSPAITLATMQDQPRGSRHAWWKLSPRRMIELATLAACLVIFAGLLLPAVQAPREAARRLGAAAERMEDYVPLSDAVPASKSAPRPPSHASVPAESNYREFMETPKSDPGVVIRGGTDIDYAIQPDPYFRQSGKSSEIVDGSVPAPDTSRYWSFHPPKADSNPTKPQGPQPSLGGTQAPATTPSLLWDDERYDLGSEVAVTDGIKENAQKRGQVTQGMEPARRQITPPLGNTDIAKQPQTAEEPYTFMMTETPRILIPKEEVVEDLVEAKGKSDKSIDRLSVFEKPQSNATGGSLTPRDRKDQAESTSELGRKLLVPELRLESSGVVAPEEARLRELEESKKERGYLGDQAEKSESGIAQNTARFKHLSDWEGKQLQTEDTTADFDNEKSAMLGWFKDRSAPENGMITGKSHRVERDLGRKLNQPLVELSPLRETTSTFSLHVSDVSFKLAQNALAQGQLPDPNSIRIEEFVNAMDYRDPLPGRDAKVACVVEQAIHPFRLQRNLLRVSLRTAALGRSATTPLRLTVLLDNSGSMERPDRRAAVLRAVDSLTQQLNANDQVTLIAFARTAHLLADRVRGDQSASLVDIVQRLPSEGGTNLEAALALAREKALEQSTDGAQNRIILMTDGAVNLGNANPESLAQQIVQLRSSGIALDVAGMGVRDLKDDLLEVLARQGDGRYYLLDTPETVEDSFANQIAGALRPSAMNVKVQVEFNPQRVASYKLYGFDNHLLKAEDFRNDRVDAAELSAEEAGVAIYQFEPIANGSGEVGSVSVRFRDAVSGEMIEHRWPIPYEPSAPKLETASPSMKLAATTALFAAKLAGGPLADNVELPQLAAALATLPDAVMQHPRVQQLRAMIQTARDLQ